MDHVRRTDKVAMDHVRRTDKVARQVGIDHSYRLTLIQPA